MACSPRTSTPSSDGASSTRSDLARVGRPESRSVSTGPARIGDLTLACFREVRRTSRTRDGNSPIGDTPSSSRRSPRRRRRHRDRHRRSSSSRHGRCTRGGDPEPVGTWEAGGDRIARRNVIAGVCSEHIGSSAWAVWSVLVLFLGRRTVAGIGVEPWLCCRRQRCSTVARMRSQSGHRPSRSRRLT